MTLFRVTRTERTEYELSREDVERLLAYERGEADEFSDEQLAAELLENLPIEYTVEEPAGVGEQLADEFTGKEYCEDSWDVEVKANG